MKYNIVYDGFKPEAKHTEYYFAAEGLKNAQDLFYDLYEEDIEDYIQERIWDDEEEYKVTAAILCLTVSNKTGKVKYATLSPQIEYVSGESLELEDCDVKLKKKFVDELMKLVNKDNKNED